MVIPLLANQDLTPMLAELRPFEDTSLAIQATVFFARNHTSIELPISRSLFVRSSLNSSIVAISKVLFQNSDSKSK